MWSFVTVQNELERFLAEQVRNRSGTGQEPQQDFTGGDQTTVNYSSAVVLEGVCRGSAGANTYGTCRAPWPPLQLAPGRLGRSCSICPWLCRLRCRSLRWAAAVLAAAAEREARAEPPAAPCSDRTATTFGLDGGEEALSWR